MLERKGCHQLVGNKTILHSFTPQWEFTSAEGATLMWKLARKAVVGTSALPRSTVVPCWEPSFLFPIKRPAKGPACPLQGNWDKSHGTLPCPAGRSQGSAQGCYASPALVGHQKGFHLCQGSRVVVQEGKLYGKHLGRTKLRKKAAVG